MHIETVFVHGGDAHKSVTGSISMPIYQTATFEHPALSIGNSAVTTTLSVPWMN